MNKVRPSYHDDRAQEREDIKLRLSSAEASRRIYGNKTYNSQITKIFDLAKKQTPKRKDDFISGFVSKLSTHTTGVNKIFTNPESIPPRPKRSTRPIAINETGIMNVFPRSVRATSTKGHQRTTSVTESQETPSRAAYIRFPSRKNRPDSISFQPPNLKFEPQALNDKFQKYKLLKTEEAPQSVGKGPLYQFPFKSTKRNSILPGGRSYTPFTPQRSIPVTKNTVFETENTLQDLKEHKANKTWALHESFDEKPHTYSRKRNTSPSLLLGALETTNENLEEDLIKETSVESTLNPNMEDICLIQRAVRESKDSLLLNSLENFGSLDLAAQTKPREVLEKRKKKPENFYQIEKRVPPPIENYGPRKIIIPKNTLKIRLSSESPQKNGYGPKEKLPKRKNSPQTSIAQRTMSNQPVRKEQKSERLPTDLGTIKQSLQEVLLGILEANMMNNQKSYDAEDQNEHDEYVNLLEPSTTDVSSQNKKSSKPRDLNRSWTGK